LGRHEERFSFDIIGEAGIGKTAIAKQALMVDAGLKQFAKKTRVVVINPSQFVDPSDMSGFPQTDYLVTVDGKPRWVSKELVSNLPLEQFVYDGQGSQVRKMSYAKPTWWPRDEDEIVALIIDDDRRSTSLIQQALMDLFYTYIYMGSVLPKNVLIVATNNPDNGHYNVQSLDGAQERRKLTLNADFNLDVWLEYSANEFDSNLLMFLMHHPEAMKRQEGTNTVYEIPANVTRLNTFLGHGNPKEGKLKDVFMQLGSVFFNEKSTFISQYSSFLDSNKHKLPSAKDFFTKSYQEIEKELVPFKNSLASKGICARRVIQHLLDTDYKSNEARLMEYFEKDLFTVDKKKMMMALLLLHKTELKINAQTLLSNPIFVEYLDSESKGTYG
jgi:hypothetical protein